MAGDREDKTSLGKQERGSVIIEMALVLPLLLLVVAGIIDLGTLYWEKQILTNATGEGARLAAQAGAGGAAQRRSSEVLQLSQDYLDRFKLKDPNGSRIVLTSGGNFNYQWNTALTPPELWVEITNIPVQQLLLPNIQPLFRGASSNPTLRAKTTVAAEWTIPPLP